MHSETSSIKLLDGLLLVVLALIWGSSYILMKRGLIAFPALQLAGVRTFISFLVLSPFVFRALHALKRHQLKYMLMISFFGSGFPAILYAFSLTRVDSSVAGVINSMVPLFTMIIGLLFFNLAFSFPKLIGVFVGLIGASALVLVDAEGQFYSDYIYALMPVLATVFYGLNSNLLKRHFNEISPIHLTSLIYFFVGIPGGTYLLFTDFGDILLNHQHGWQSLGYIALLATLGSAFAMVLFAKLIQRTSALFATTVTYLIPIVALIWGLFDGEKLGHIQLLGMTLIILGVYTVNRSFYKTKQSVEAGRR